MRLKEMHEREGSAQLSSNFFREVEIRIGMQQIAIDSIEHLRGRPGGTLRGQLVGETDEPED